MILTKEQIDKCFEVNHQGEVVVNLYKLVIPDWDLIEKVKGWPRAGRAISDYIFKKFFDFDEKHHPDVLKGGAWMNNGWSVDDDLEGWEVIVDGTILIYKSEVKKT